MNLITQVPVRLRILQIPAANSAGWRHNIARVCRDNDWDYVEYWGGEEPALTPNRNCVIVCWDDSGEALFATDWVILSCTPDAAVSVLRHNLSLSRTDAIYHASARFALAGYLAQCGASVFYDTGPEIVLPVLGVVSGPEQQAVDPDRERVPELDFYEVLPPVVGTVTHWPSNLFAYPGGPVVSSQGSKFFLLGRRRLLMNGPNISLPPGTWTARATFAVEPRGKADLFIEWGHGVDVEIFSQIFDVGGRYQLELTKTWNVTAPADFRISLMMPVLDGEFSFEGLDLTFDREA